MRFCDDRFLADRFLPTKQHWRVCFFSCAAKLSIFYFGTVGSIAADHCHALLVPFKFLPIARHSGIGDTVEPRKHGVQFSDDRCQVRVCDALSYHGWRNKIKYGLWIVWIYFNVFVSLKNFEQIYWNEHNTMLIQFHVWKKLCKKPICLKINIFPFDYSTTIKVQWENLNSIHVPRRGQSPNNRMMIMCKLLFQYLIFRRQKKKKIVKKYAVCALR